MATDEILIEVEEKMDSDVNYLRRELRGIRTGRASAGLVEHLKVEYYGSPTDLRQLATISTPDATTIIIKPFDPASLKDIEKAIQAGDLGIMPSIEGKMIRLTIPPLSMERRGQLSAQINKMGEAAKVAVRNARRDGNKHADKQQKSSELTEDEARKGKAEIQDLTNKYEKMVDDILTAKNKEIQET